jgi:hypothetical protein
MAWIQCDIDGQFELVFIDDETCGPKDALVWPEGFHNTVSCPPATFAQLPKGFLESRLRAERAQSPFSDR